MIFDDASFRFLNNNNNKKTANLFIKLFISVLFVNYKFFLKFNFACNNNKKKEVIIKLFHLFVFSN